jgi:hypothetical protein
MFLRTGDSTQKFSAIHIFASFAGAEKEESLRQRATAAEKPSAGRTHGSRGSRPVFAGISRGKPPDDAGRHPETRLRAHSNGHLLSRQSAVATKADSR